jgi:hypothetical protein
MDSGPGPSGRPGMTKERLAQDNWKKQNFPSGAEGEPAGPRAAPIGAPPPQIPVAKRAMMTMVKTCITPCAATARK